MINEIEALLGVLILIIIIYFFIWQRSKIIGGMGLLFAGLSTIPIFGGTDFELISWSIIFACLVAIILGIAHQQLAKVTS